MLAGAPSGWPAAREILQRVVAADGGWYQPLARIGLATLARIEDRPWDGLAELRRAEASLAQLDDAEAIVQMARCKWHEEAGRCYLALGLPDRAAPAFERFRELARGASPRVRCEVVLACVDQCLSRSDWSGARREIEVAGREAAIGAAAPVGAFELRDLIAARNLALGARESAEVAQRCEDLAGRAGLQAARRDAVIQEAAVAWLEAGMPDRAAELIAGLRARPFDSVLHHAEVEAIWVRALLARAAPAAELRPAHAEFAGLFDRLLAEWRRMPPREGGIGAFRFDSRRAVLAALLSLDRVVHEGDEAASAAFEHLEAARSLGSLARRLGAVAPTLAQVRAHLVPEAGGVLAYAVQPAGGHLIAIDRDGALHVEIPCDAALCAEIDRVHDAIVRAPADASPAAVRALRERAQRLAERLLTPALRERLARWRRVVLVGDRSVPPPVWQSLPWQDGWLCTAKAISHVPSAAVALRLSERARSRTAVTGLELAVIGDPVLADGAAARWGVEALSLRASQRQALAAGAPSGRARAWWGADASAATLADPAVATARRLCVVAHGVQDFERERFAGLLLAPGAASDGVVFADAIEQLRAPPLVVLGTCGAAAGPVRFGDEAAAHLGGAFLVAGADAVVLASGDLSLGATIDLFADMSARIDHGARVADAVRDARGAIAAVNSREHPYFFAGLVVLGCGDAPMRAASLR